MDNATFQKLKDFISKYQNIGIIVSPNSNLDQMAAGLSFFLVLKLMGKNVNMVSPTDINVSLSSLVGIDNVKKSFSNSGGDLTVSFPYKEGEIDKVSYNLENGKLNIVVKSGEKGISFAHEDVSFIRSGSVPELLICVGIAKLSEIAGIYTPTPEKITAVINIDNKIENEKYGDMIVVDNRWSSLSEQVADFVTLLEPQIELDGDISQNLLNGIMFATNNFTGSKTSYLAFEVAGILMKKGATRQKAIEVIGLSKGSSANVSLDNQFFPNPRVNVRSQQAVGATSQVNNPIVVPVNQTQPAQTQNINNEKNTLPEAPPDWLTPKVYKGSSII